MKYIKSYKIYKESLVVDTFYTSMLEIMESMNLSHEELLKAINAEELDIYDTLKLHKDFYENRLNLDFLSKNIEFINSLSSLNLKKSQVQNSDDYETFMNKSCKWMFIYDMNSNELENPMYLIIQSWDDNEKDWETVRFYKVNGESKRFYDKLSSKTLDIKDGDDSYIYSTSDGNTWSLNNIDKMSDIYKKSLDTEELKKIIKDRNLKISII